MHHLLTENCVSSYNVIVNKNNYSLENFEILVDENN